MHVQHLTSVDGEIVFDFDPDLVSPVAAGVRMAEGLTVEQAARLARRRTQMCAAFEVRMAGATVAVRPRLLTSRADTIAALVDELATTAGEDFVPFPDLGITHAELSPVAPRPRFDTDVDGVPLGELSAGRGVAAAAQAWLGDLDGVTVAVEGFGVTGSGVARDLTRRGARIVALSTERGAVADAGGFDIAAVVAARDEHGDAFVRHLDLEVHLPRELHELPVDVIVSGAGVGFYDEAKADLVQARVIVPSGADPYTPAGLDVLRGAGVAALPATLSAAGDLLADTAPIGLSADEVLGRVDRLITERVEAARLSKMDPIDYADTLADTFATTWLPSRG